MKLDEIKCPKCGFMNAYGSKKCYKCNTVLRELKSCPKCAKKNDIAAKKCVSCGFDFSKKRRSVWFSLVISVLLMVFLFVCVKLGKKSIINGVGLGFRIVAVLIICSLIYVTFTYGKKEKINYAAEEEMATKNPVFNRMKLISSIAVVIGLIAAAVFIIVKFVLKK